MRLSSSILSALVAAGVVACGDSKVPTGEPTNNANGASGNTLVVSGAGTVAPGATAPLYAMVRGASGDSIKNPQVQWVSRTPSVATVTPSGAAATVTGVALGTAWIVATSGDAADSVNLTVRADQPPPDSAPTPPQPVATVTVTPASQTISVGDSAGVFANLKSASGATLFGNAVTWSVSDASVVSLLTYGQSGLLRGLKSGTVTITATSEGKSGTATVTVR